MNYKDKKWQSIIIERGQIVTSINNLSIELGLSHRKIRTALSNLEDSESIKVEATNKYSIVTIVNYNLYQGAELYSDNQKTNKEQTDDNQTTTTKQVNNITSEQSVVKIGDARDFCLNNNVWVEAVKGSFVLNSNQFSEYIEEFTSHATLNGTVAISPENYKKYFVRWYKKRTGKGFKGRKLVKQPRQFL